MDNTEDIMHSEQRAQKEIDKLDRNRQDSILAIDDADLWFNPEIVKDISRGVQKKFYWIIAICLTFIIIEIIGGLLSSSIAIFTDVAHLLSDLIGFIFSLVAITLAKKRANIKFTYGFARAEVLGALFSVVLIWGMTSWIVFEAIDRLNHREYLTVNPKIMFITSLIGLFVNLLMGFTLHSHGHGHGHDHGHGHGHSHGHNHGHSHKHGSKCDHKLKKTGEKHKHGDKCKHKKHDDSHKDEHEHLQHQEETRSENIGGQIQEEQLEDRTLSHLNIPVIRETKDDLVTKNHKKHSSNTRGQKHNDKDCNDHHDKEPEVKIRVSSPTDQYLTEEHTTQDKDHLSEQLINKRRNKMADLNLSLMKVEDSHNIRAAWIHIIGDTVQSLGVILVSVVIWIRDDWKFLDPVLSITFSIIALTFSFRVLKDIIHVIMDTTPPNLDVEILQGDLQNIKFVKEIHDFHVWQLAHGKPSLTCHITATEHPIYVLKKATLLVRKLGIYHSTIQVEIEDSGLEVDCKHNIHL